MFCYKCGKQLPDDAMFCSSCGTAVQNAPVSQPIPAVEPKQPVSKPEKPKKEKNPQKKKTLLLILGSVVLLSAVIALVLGVTSAQKKSKKIAEIPDPETYFGLSAEHEVEEYTHTIRFETDAITQQMAEAYVNLLCSNQYPFELLEAKENVFDSTNTVERIYRLAYTGTEELYHNTAHQIFVSHYSSPVYDPHTSILVFSHTNFEFVSAEILDLSSFADVPAIELGEKHFSPNDEEEEVPEANMVSDSGSAPEPTPEPAPTPEPEPQPTQQPTSKPSDSDPSVLPDFLAHDASGKFELDEGQSRKGKVFYVAPSDELQYVIEDYMKLLKGLGYTVVYEYDKEHTAGTHNIVMKRSFYHSGVDAEAVWKSESNGQVRVQTNTYPEKNKTNIVIYYSDGITMEGFDGGSGSSGGGSNQCSACLGDGKCNICNGSDTVSRFQAGIGWVTQNCTACSMGQCPFCNGTGR